MTKTLLSGFDITQKEQPTLFLPSLAAEESVAKMTIMDPLDRPRKTVHLGSMSGLKESYYVYAKTSHQSPQWWILIGTTKNISSLFSRQRA